MISSFGGVACEKKSLWTHGVGLGSWLLEAGRLLRAEVSGFCAVVSKPQDSIWN